MFWSINLNKNAEPDKHEYRGHGIGFDSCPEFSLTDDSVSKNLVIVGVDMSSSGHIDNKNNDILILDKTTKQGLNNTTLAAIAEYSINCTRLQRTFLSKSSLYWKQPFFIC